MGKLKPNFIVIPAITVTTASLGSIITANGMAWYRQISLPEWTPPGSFIGAVWTTIFILATISALSVWNTKIKTSSRRLIFSVFFINAFLNALWSYLFFGLHFVATAVVEASLLEITVLVLIYLIYPIKKFASYLLLPYAIWVTFATYLTFVVFKLNAIP